jgi:SAM-dependent methyltransferase
MAMNEPKLADWYDCIYGGKDYRGETDTILAEYDRWHGGRPRAVLDIGCGTGNHGLELARRGIYVCGCDAEADMVAVATRKAEEAKLPADFHACNVLGIEGRGFDLALAMFNVVNYTLTVAGLDLLLAETAARVAQGGLFVFDTWDPILAESDPPEPRTYEAECGSPPTIIHRIATPTYVRRTERVTVQNAVTIMPPDAPAFRLAYAYQHRVWHVGMILDRLAVHGWKPLRMQVPWGRRSVLYVATRLPKEQP